jgi:molecular chaperone GrpE
MEKGIEVCHNLKDNSATVKGMELTLQIMLNALKKFEIFQINPQNSSFDPNKHEAMAMQVSDTMPDNRILSVFQKGYELNNRVIRPARVSVVKKN